jgi:UDP-N-acetyl-2-amino-2-deoxyglucuronate dehydrogenase
VELEQETGREAYTILQLRLHDKIAALREKVKNGPKDKIYDVDLTYITRRGKWYYSSWKGDVHKAGGIATNIGVHFYDMLQWIFGAVKQNIVHVMSFDRVAGYLDLEHARVRYFLSINADCLPANAVQGEKKGYYAIYNTSGWLIERKEIIDTQQQIETPLTPGIYIIHIYYDTQIYTRKVIVR